MKYLVIASVILLLGAGCTSDSSEIFDKKLSCANQTATFNSFLDDDVAAVTERQNELPGFMKHELKKVCYSSKYNSCIAQVSTDYSDRAGIKARASALYDMFTFQLLEHESTLLDAKQDVDYAILLKMNCIE